MKLSQFLKEARTVAGEAAAKRGLSHAGHGYYADRQGNIVAKSEGGERLVAVSKKEADHGKGVIRDASIQGRILEEIKAFGNEVMVGAELIFETEARPSGTDGNKEFFLAWKKQD